MGLSGDRHRRMRQLLMPSFHVERMRSYGQLIRDITKEVMSQWGAGEVRAGHKIAHSKSGQDSRRAREQREIAQKITKA